MINVSHNKAQNRQTFVVWLLNAPLVTLSPFTYKTIGTLLAQTANSFAQLGG
jgi:hypothetical protein